MVFLSPSYFLFSDFMCASVFGGRAALFQSDRAIGFLGIDTELLTHAMRKGLDAVAVTREHSKRSNIWQ